MEKEEGEGWWQVGSVIDSHFMRLILFVVLGERFPRGSLVETSHCLLFTGDDVAHAHATILREYTFTTGEFKLKS